MTEKKERELQEDINYMFSMGSQDIPFEEALAIVKARRAKINADTTAHKENEMKYIRWSEVTKARNSFFALGIATLDLDSELGQALVKGMPQFFSEEPDDRFPVPLSLMREVANRASRSQMGEDLDELYSDDGDSHFDVPSIIFGIDGENDHTPTPMELKEFTDHKPIGTKLTYLDQEMVIIQSDGTYLALVPARCVTVDIEVV